MTDKMDENRLDAQRKELLSLLKTYAYKKGEYTLSSGKKSEHYVNCKPVTLSARGITLASLLMLKEVDTPYVAGLTLGADPLVSGVALVSALENKMINALIVRKAVSYTHLTLPTKA